jgi:hypothetical protein
LSCPRCPELLHVLTSCPLDPVQVDLSGRTVRLTWFSCPFPTIIPYCPVLTVLTGLSCPGCPVLVVLSLLSCTSFEPPCPFCPVQADLSTHTCPR